MQGFDDLVLSEVLMRVRGEGRCWYSTLFYSPRMSEETWLWVSSSSATQSTLSSYGGIRRGWGTLSSAPSRDNSQTQSQSTISPNPLFNDYARLGPKLVGVCARDFLFGNSSFGTFERPHHPLLPSNLLTRDSGGDRKTGLFVCYIQMSLESESRTKRRIKAKLAQWSLQRHNRLPI